MQKIILASASPRRRELLTQIGMNFEIYPPKGEEIVTKKQPWEVVQELAEQKAKEVAFVFQQSLKESFKEQGTEQEFLQYQEEGKKEISFSTKHLVIGADTLVAYKNQILGKPKSEKEAIEILTMLSGTTHSVYTGVTIAEVTADFIKTHNFYEETKVTMYPITPEEIRKYVETKEPMDKAGAYGIQGKSAIFVKEIQGDYNNVVGLPIAALYQKMRKLGIEI